MPVYLTDGRKGIVLISREYEGASLMHYRVGGEKKGVRRWQDKQGHYTPEGYKHYAEMYGWGKGRKSGQNTDASEKQKAPQTQDFSAVKQSKQFTSAKKRVQSVDREVSKLRGKASEAIKKSVESMFNGKKSDSDKYSELFSKYTDETNKLSEDLQSKIQKLGEAAGLGKTTNSEGCLSFVLPAITSETRKRWLSFIAD